MPDSLGGVERDSSLVSLEVHDLDLNTSLALEVELEADGAIQVERDVIETASPGSFWDVHDLDTLWRVADGVVGIAAGGVGSVLNPVIEDGRTRRSFSGDGDGVSENFVRSAAVESGGVDGQVSDVLIVGDFQDSDEHHSMDLSLVDSREVIQRQDESGKLVGDLEDHVGLVSVSVLEFDHDVDVSQLMDGLFSVVDNGQASVEFQVGKASEVDVVIAGEDSASHAAVGGVSGWCGGANDPASATRTQVLKSTNAGFGGPGDVERA